jgi:hypothetical protein
MLFLLPLLLLLWLLLLLLLIYPLCVFFTPDTSDRRNSRYQQEEFY